LAVLAAGATEVACSGWFGCGFAAGGCAFDAALSAGGVVTGAGIVIVGFVALAAGFEEDCAAAGGSRRTGLNGPADDGGDSEAAEGCAGAAVSGSAAREPCTADSIESETRSDRIAAREPARRCFRLGGCGIAPPVLGAD
jgi:hypothetical protein